MKVSFNLTPAQVERANVVVQMQDHKNPPTTGAKWGGNLLGWLEDHGFSFNSDQHLELAGNVVTYTGQRHPMLKDGAARILAYIVSGVHEYAFDSYGIQRRRAEPEMLEALKVLWVNTYLTRETGWQWFECNSDHPEPTWEGKRFDHLDVT